MIVDASALLAVILDEADKERFNEAMVDAVRPLMISPVNYIEIVTRLLPLKNGQLLGNLDEVILFLGIVIAPVTAEQTQIAREAYTTYGKGRHPARLNIGDCFAYALAKSRREPLLFKGDDFTRTDIEAAL